MLLVFAAMKIAVLVGFAFAGEAEGAVTIDKIIAWIEDTVVVVGFKFIIHVRIEVDATNSVYEIDKGEEIDAQIM